MRDGFHRVGFGVSDESDGSALDPARRVDAGEDVVAVVHDLSLVIRNHSVTVVEWDAVEFCAVVADRAVKRVNR